MADEFTHIIENGAALAKAEPAGFPNEKYPSLVMIAVSVTCEVGTGLKDTFVVRIRAVGGMYDTIVPVV